MADPARGKSATASGQLHTGPGFVSGFIAYETSGSAAAVVKIYDGTSTSGQLLDVIKLASGTTDAHLYGAHVWFSTGLYFDLTSGAATIVAHIG